IGKKVTGRSAAGRVAGVTEPGGFDRDEPDARVTTSYVCGFVGAAVVDDNDLEVGIAQRRRVTKAFVKSRGGVVGADDDAQSRPLDRQIFVVGSVPAGGDWVQRCGRAIGAGQTEAPAID